MLINTDTFCLLHPFQFRENCGEHYDEAKTAADNIGDGFGHKNAVWANVQGIRQDISQGHHNDDFTQYGEKDGIFLLVEGFENCLAHILQQHEDKCSKIKFHGGDGIGHQGLIRAENTDQEARCSQNHAPDVQRIDQR